MKKSRHQKRGIFYLIIILIIIGGFFFLFQEIYALAIYPRVYCADNLRLTGLKFNEAKSLIEILVEKIEKQGFSFSAQTEFGEKQITIQPTQIALTDPDLSRHLVSFDVNKTLENAFQIGREGNFYQRIKKIILSLTRDQTVDLVFEINQDEILRVLEENFKELEKPAQNAHLLISNQELILTQELAGFILDYDTSIEQLKTGLKSFQNKEIKIDTLFKEPQIKAENSEKAFIQAQDLFNFAPYTLVHKNKKWILPDIKIGEWFEFKRGGFGKVVLGFNQQSIQKYLQEIAKEIDIDPIRPQLEIENERVIEFQVGRSGFLLDQEKNAMIIAQMILNKKKQVDLKVDEIEPASLSEDIDSLGIKELIAEGSSNFAGSPKNRRYNIKVGSEKLHGVLIKQNQEFSLVQAIGEVNKEAGFLPELVIKGDRTIPEYGGGLCQIGTTMFRLAINAGLPITERRPHSYRVSYYEPAGMDATIYTPWPDLKFINDTNHHLLLQTEIQGDELIYKFYGTSDGRLVETTKPELSKITQPGPVQYIETTELPPGEKKKIESAHAGANAEFKNIVTFPNGIVREEIWKSYYRPWSEVWLIGKEERDTNILMHTNDTNKNDSNND
ncbi:VanW family protein [Patescibacteria group bacterium]|nr:VanW family protein [Patescibacteria group bacterium]